MASSELPTFLASVVCIKGIIINRNNCLACLDNKIVLAREMVNQTDIGMHKQEGMYLYSVDGVLLDLSKERVVRLTQEYWNDPAKLPLHIRQNDAFKACSVCPLKDQEVFCSTLKPLLPFLEDTERFNSYDKVTAIYVKKEGLAYISETTMQDALQYVTNMSIFEYCEGAKKYHRYFRGIEPFMNMNESRSRLLLNIYWLYHGDREKVRSAIDEMQQVITVISKNAVARLNIMCKSDAFSNAYVKAHNTVAFLPFIDIEVTLEDYFTG
jgi:hypothetical protein